MYLRVMYVFVLLFMDQWTDSRSDHSCVFVMVEIFCVMAGHGTGEFVKAKLFTKKPRTECFEQFLHYANFCRLNEGCFFCVTP